MSSVTVSSVHLITNLSARVGRGFILAHHHFGSPREWNGSLGLCQDKCDDDGMWSEMSRGSSISETDILRRPRDNDMAVINVESASVTYVFFDRHAVGVQI